MAMRALREWLGRSLKALAPCLATLVFAVFVSVGFAAAAQAVEGSHSDSFGRGQSHFSVIGGYGFSISRNGSDTKSSEYGAVGASLAIGITDPLWGDAWYRANIDVIAEATLLVGTQPEKGLAGGGSVLLRWNWLRYRRIVPFLSVGAGMVDLDFNLQSQRDGLNFLVQGGLGTYIFLTKSYALNAEWRYQHISNLNLRLPNKGIDASVFFIGSTFFFD